MTKLILRLIGSFIVAAFLAITAFAQDEEALKKDLTAVIALHGLPCGEVVDVKVLADSDYGASCKDGHKYHVYLSKEGRVVVDPQN